VDGDGPHPRTKADLNQREKDLEKPAWNRAKQVFNDALKETGAERAKFVEGACGGDPKLLELVLALLKANEEAGGFLSETTLESVLPESDVLPQRIGPYEVLGVLGAGGMGTVYRGKDPDLSRELAIKVLPDGLASSHQLARFGREARLLASLNHPNIATIHAIGETDGRPYLVLELIEGESLSQKLKGHPLTVEDAVEIGRQVTEALGAAHEAGIVHRDLKPANVMISPRGLVKILDFGIAKARGASAPAPDPMEITGDGTLLGTVPYLSPEQIRGDDVDERSDLWALGCLLYEALTGLRPFERSTTAATLVAIQTEVPELGALPVGTPEAVKRLISDCLEKDPTSRPASAETVRALLSDTLIRLRGPAVGQRAGKKYLRRVGWMAVGVLATTMALAVAEGSLVRAILECIEKDESGANPATGQSCRFLAGGSYRPGPPLPVRELVDGTSLGHGLRGGRLCLAPLPGSRRRGSRRPPLHFGALPWHPRDRFQ
jgi:hypothetical protein